MPQLDPSGYLSQVFWLAITFASLYFVIAYKSLPMLKKTVTGRRDLILENLDKATKLKEDVEAKSLEQTELMKKTRAKISALHEEANMQIKHSHSAKNAELDKIIMTNLRNAQSEVDSYIQDNKDEFKEVSYEFAAKIVEGLIGGKVDTQKLKKIEL